MLRWFAVPVCVIVSALSALASAEAAESSQKLLEIPGSFRGAWYLGTCDNADFRIFFGDTYIVSGSTTPSNGTDPRQTQYTQVVVSLTGNFETIGPNRIVVHQQNPFTDEIEYITFDINSGILRQDKDGQPETTQSWTRCAEPKRDGQPLAIYAQFFRDADELLTSLTAVRARCTSASADCVQTIIELLDVDRNGKIAPAEVARFIRRAAKLSMLFRGAPSSDDPTVRFVTLDPDAIVAAQMAAARFGPALTSLIFANLDYNGDGLIGADEIATTMEQMPDITAADTDRWVTEAKQNENDLLPALQRLANMLGVDHVGR
jgi:hypothetical protein